MRATKIKTCCVCGFTNGISRGKFIDVDTEQDIYAHEHCAKHVRHQLGLKPAERKRIAAQAVIPPVPLTKAMIAAAQAVDMRAKTGTRADAKIRELQRRGVRLLKGDRRAILLLEKAGEISGSKFELPPESPSVREKPRQKRRAR